MKKIAVHASTEYEVIVNAGAFKSCGSLISGVFTPCRALVISDETVFALYGDALVSSLEQSGFSCDSFVLEAGEKSKNAENLFSLWNYLSDKSYSRGDVIVSLGGGVVSDIAGFCAATYMRGIRFYEIPTTLLAMLDASVGGKTAINLENGKNAVGAIYQPSGVLIDTELLGTLPERQIAQGMAEAVKCGMIRHDILDKIERGASTEEIIYDCVSLKRDVVERDERDNSVRKLLNFGHTAGHAAEVLSGYSLPHGEAVAAGMVAFTRAAVKMGLCDASRLERLVSATKKFGLTTSFSYTADELFAAAMSDKKRVGDSFDVVLPAGNGCEIRTVSKSELYDIIVRGVTNDDA
ncbi:MAG: 3-dehydroquinate synthase [Clostridiales bacterium]|nr:3-dehydroquinate synthase [Clostridiales bacterium]